MTASERGGRRPWAATRRGACALLALAACAAQAGTPAAGRAKSAVCAACHGQDGRSQMPEAPHLAGQVEGYLVAQLRAFKSGERRNEQMSIIARPLSAQDIDDLAAYYASLAPGGGGGARP